MGRWFNNYGDGVLIHWGDDSEGWLRGCGDAKWMERYGSLRQDIGHLTERDEAYAMKWLKVWGVTEMPPSFNKTAGLDGAEELRAAVRATRDQLDNTKNQMQTTLLGLRDRLRGINNILTLAKEEGI